MIVDCFLFFQELELLEIRLEYLYDVVDKFIIVEAAESFSGNAKSFLFEENIYKFEKYIDKIHYYKIYDRNKSYKSLIKKLENKKEAIYKSIKSILVCHKHYDKKILPFVLDSYHRECIHIPMKEICKDNDIIILSDLDEIPDKNLIKNIKTKNFQLPIVLKQKEFKYFLNLYSNSNWEGSIIDRYKGIKNNSLNNLRLYSKSYDIYFPGGYHFTSVGGIEILKKKLENWGHQEYKLNIIKKNLKNNIENGRDIFYRFGENKNKIIEIRNSEFFDSEMSEIISRYTDLLIKGKINFNLVNSIKFRYQQLLIYSIRFIKEPNKAFKKIAKKINLLIE